MRLLRTAKVNRALKMALIILLRFQSVSGNFSPSLFFFFCWTFLGSVQASQSSRWQTREAKILVSQQKPQHKHYACTVYRKEEKKIQKAPVFAAGGEYEGGA